MLMDESMRQLQRIFNIIEENEAQTDDLNERKVPILNISMKKLLVEIIV